MHDSHALVQAYANLHDPIGGLQRIKDRLRWDDVQLYTAFIQLVRQASELNLQAEGECEHLSRKLSSLRIHPRDESPKRYLLVR